MERFLVLDAYIIQREGEPVSCLWRITRAPFAGTIQIRFYGYDLSGSGNIAAPAPQP
jgi:hypothetical protein